LPARIQIVFLTDETEPTSVVVAVADSFPEGSQYPSLWKLEKGRTVHAYIARLHI
jgi:hypothetical protein